MTMSVLYCTVHQTRFGPLTIGSTGRGLAMLRIGTDIEARVARQFTIKFDAEANHSYIAALESYLRTGDIPDVPLDLHGTDFQLRCWQALQGIPKGETRSYLHLATQVASKTATRAVGGANGANPVAIIVPCHRVIAADGTLGGYGGGLPMKAALLDLEGAKYRWTGEVRTKAKAAGADGAQAQLPY